MTSKPSLPNTYIDPNGTYYLRLIWPADIRRIAPVLGKDIRLSLRTANPKTARTLSSQLLTFFLCCIDEIREISYKDQSVIDLCISLKRNLRRSMLKLTEVTFPNGAGIKVDHKDDKKEREAIKALLKEHPELLTAALTPPPPQVNAPDPIPEERQLSVNAVIKKYTEAKTPSWSGKTANQSISRLEVMAEMLGADTAFHTLTANDVVELKDNLLRYPQNMRAKAMKGLSWKEIQALDFEYPTVTRQTADKYLKLFKSVCQFAVSNRFHETNISAEISMDFVPRVNQVRPAFNRNDLNLIFTGYIYTAQPLKRKRTLLTAYFWLPLIAAHTGARLNEIAQLRIQDVDIDHTTPHFIIDGKGEQQSVKTPQSNRIVPIHSALIKCGFLDFVKERQAETNKPSDRLFEGLPYDKNNGYGKKVSRWFNGEKASPGYMHTLDDALSEPETQCFESFRQTFISHLSGQNVADRHIQSLSGHKGKHTSEIAHYSGSQPLAQAQMIVELVDYGIDLSHISFTAFKQYAAQPTKTQK